ncbi:hypothetical protein GOODEAATRI_018487 [Goodea atripinnis]|uniref:Uncharacterized protein n=1 Tax=Goodea atripinnis TaxID=208336 RepID=A0ABV0NLA1_9TELE
MEALILDVVVPGLKPTLVMFATCLLPPFTPFAVCLPSEKNKTTSATKKNILKKMTFCQSKQGLLIKACVKMIMDFPLSKECSNFSSVKTDQFNDVASNQT